MGRRFDGAVTLSDVARHAGVSLATASRAVNGSATRVVGAELGERVRRSAELLGYAPDGNAQAMAKGATRTVGVAVHDLTDPYFAAIADAMTVEGDRRGLFLTLATTANRPDHLHEVVQSLETLRVRAIALVGGRWSGPVIRDDLGAAIDRYRTRGGRVVAIGFRVPGLDSVLIDNESGSVQLADHLADRGYRRPLLLCGEMHHSTAEQRSEAFVARAAERGIDVPDTHRLTSAFTRAGGADAMRRALAARLDADVVVATNDVMAIGAMAEARDAGVDIPASMGFAGYGDVGAVRDVMPALTTVRVPTAELGQRAIALAMDGPGDGTGTVTLPVRLVARASTPRRG